MAEIKAGCVVVTEFTSPGSDVFSGYIDYINRKEAVRNNNIEKFSLYNDYMGNPVKTEGLFTEQKNDLTTEEKKALKSVFQKAQENGSLMWQTVISFDNRWLEHQGVYNSATKRLDDKKLKEVTRNSVREMLKNENLENAIWSAAIHYNTDNIHIHIATVELFPQRKTKIINGKEEYVGRFKMSSIEACKSKMVNGLMQEKDLNIMINHIIRDRILAQKEKLPLVKDQELAQAFFQLYNNLPDCKRNLWQYRNNKLKDVRPEIDHLTDLYLRKYHMSDMKELDRVLKKQSAVYEISYGETNRDFRMKKYDDLYRRMGNAILKEMKNFDEWYQEQPDIIEKLIMEHNLKMKDDFNISDIEPLIYFEFEPNDMGVDIIDQNISFQDTHGEVYLEWTDEYKAAKGIVYGKDKKVIKDNFEKRFKMMYQEYKKGNVLAAYDLGEYYQYGKGCEIDKEKSTFYYKEAFNGFVKLKESIEDEKIGKEAYLDYRIAKHFNRGLGVEQDQEEAAKYFFLAADKGNGYAQYSLANMYKNGVGVEQDYEEALMFFELSDRTLKAKSMPFCTYQIANLYEKGLGTERDELKAKILYEKALKEFVKMYEKEPDDRLSYRLGLMYMEGQGTEKDLEQAKKYLQTSVDEGNIYAGYRLAKLYEEIGEGYEDKVIEYLKVVADKGNFDFAQYALGKLYLDNESENYNVEEGIYYLKKAIENGSDLAAYELGKVYTIRDSGKYNLEEGIKYLEKAAKKDNEWAQYRLGKIYIENDSEFYDLKKGVKYLEKVAEKDNEWAQYNLGKIYTDKLLEVYDLEKGIKYLEDAVKHGNDMARYKVGIIYLKENEYYDPERAIALLEEIEDKSDALKYLIAKTYLQEEVSIYNPEKGVKTMLELADEGNEYAQLRIGTEYMKGRYFSKDINEAQRYLKMSAEQGNEYAKDILENIKKYKNYKMYRTYSKSYTPSAISQFEKMIKEIKNSLKTEYEIQKNIYEYEEIVNLRRTNELE